MTAASRISFIALILAFSLFIAACAIQQGPDMEWRCSAANCTEYLTWDEWVATTCVRDGSDILCPVVTDNQQFLIPLTELEQQVNKSTFQQCRKFVCVEEVPYRSVEPYEVNLSEAP